MKGLMGLALGLILLLCTNSLAFFNVSQIRSAALPVCCVKFGKDKGKEAKKESDGSGG